MKENEWRTYILPAPVLVFDGDIEQIDENANVARLLFPDLDRKQTDANMFLWRLGLPLQALPTKETISCLDVSDREIQRAFLSGR